MNDDKQTCAKSSGFCASTEEPTQPTREPSEQGQAERTCRHRGWLEREHAKPEMICPQFVTFDPIEPPQPTSQPQGVDLPTAPGVWTRHGEWWSVRSFELRLYGAVLRFENVPCTHEIGPTIYVNDLPRGGWLRAQPQPASEGKHAIRTCDGPIVTKSYAELEAEINKTKQVLGPHGFTAEKNPPVVVLARCVVSKIERLRKELALANHKWAAYEAEYILPSFEWARSIGMDLQAAVKATAGKNCNRLLFEAMQARIAELRTRLLSAAGDDLCRLTQEEIKAYTSGAVQIPPKGEFIASCERFHEQIAAGPGVLKNCLTLAQLVAENEKLTNELRVAIGKIDGLVAGAKTSLSQLATAQARNAELTAALRALPLNHTHGCFEYDEDSGPRFKAECCEECPIRIRDATLAGTEAGPAPTACKMLDAIPGTNCAEWECPTCGRVSVSPHQTVCTHTPDPPAPPRTDSK